ncbi:MAG: cytochrome-c peroxidase [Myxococcaceae bacterium]
MRYAWLGAVALLMGCPEKKETAPQVAVVKQPVAVVDAGPPSPVFEAPPIADRPSMLPEPPASAENPLTAEKVALGHMLFFDKRLSKDDSMACDNCHHAENAYTDSNPLDAKVGGAMNKRNSPSLVNLAFHANGFYWDGRKPTLEAVTEAAWTGQLGAVPAEIAAKLNANATYKALFQRAFKEDATEKNIPMALSSFLRVNWSAYSPWDHHEEGEKDAVPPEAVAGFEVFKKSGCALCHVPPLYTDADFHNVGIGNPEDKGRTDATKNEKDAGKFKTPSLRDVERTAPYFHDGSVATLDQAIDLMAAGGKKSKLTDPKLKRVKLSAKDKAALKAFLISLSGSYTFGSGPSELPK